jgi:hypothetical protein
MAFLMFTSRIAIVYYRFEQRFSGGALAVVRIR